MVPKELFQAFKPTTFFPLRMKQRECSLFAGKGCETSIGRYGAPGFDPLVKEPFFLSISPIRMVVNSTIFYHVIKIFGDLLKLIWAYFSSFNNR